MSKSEQKELETKINNNGRMGLFDIDGTLVEGFTIQSFAGFLFEVGHFDTGMWSLMLVDFEKYSGSSKNSQAYHEFAISLVNHYALGLRGISS